MKTWPAAFILILFVYSCSSSRHSYSPVKKYSPAQLQNDYSIYRQIMEEVHPGLYWYTSKDSMDAYFDWGRQQLSDSMTEGGFRKVLTFVTSKIKCGHTTIRPSLAATRYRDTSATRLFFPLNLKVWDDTAIITSNRNRKDSVLTRGVQLLTINNKSVNYLVDTFFNYLSGDGNNTTHKYRNLSSSGYFGTAYSALFGYPEQYFIQYAKDGLTDTVSIPPVKLVRDTSGRRPPATPPEPKPSRKQRKKFRREGMRKLSFDSTNNYAVLELNSFSKGYGLRPFFKESMRTLEKRNVQNLVVDLRDNGGGSVGLSTLFTRYFADHRFKVADTLYAITKQKKYSRYIKSDWLNRLFMTFFTRKKNDGNYHFGYYERHHFKPKKANHYNGSIYVLTGGNSFSATILFASIIQDQKNVTLIGEETGGGAYGNSAWLIPDATLPNTHLRFRLPLFRLVIDKEAEPGRGIFPDIHVPPTVESIKNNEDAVLEKTKSLILEKK